MAKAYIKVVTAMIIWGSIALFVRSVPYSSTEIVMFRIIFGLVFLVAVRALSKKPLDMAAVKGNALRLLISGVVMGLNWVALFESYRYIDVSVATVLYYCAPIFVIIGSVFFFKEKLGLAKVSAIAIAAAGMVIVTGVKAGGTDPAKGVFFVLISAVLYASVTLINKTFSGLDGLDTTIGQLIGAGLVVIPAALISHSGGWSLPDTRIILCILALGFVHTGIALYFYFSAIQELPAQSIALLSYLDPASAIIFASVFLHESLSLLQIFGAALIIGSAFFGELFGRIGKKKS